MTVTAMGLFIAEHLSARQLILHRISPSVCIYIYMYVSRLLRNAILLQARVQDGIIARSIKVKGGHVTGIPVTWPPFAFVLLAH